MGFDEIWTSAKSTLMSASMATPPQISRKFSRTSRTISIKALALLLRALMGASLGVTQRGRVDVCVVVISNSISKIKYNWGNSTVPPADMWWRKEQRAAAKALRSAGIV